MTHIFDYSDSGDDGSEDQSDGESEQLSGNFINDGDYTQDSRASGGQQHMYYAVNNALEDREEDSPGLCRLDGERVNCTMLCVP